MRFVRGKLEGTLTLTQNENHKYRWVNCLALLDKDGRWLYNVSWRTNHFKKAEKEILSLGFKKQEEVKI